LCRRRHSFKVKGEYNPLLDDPHINWDSDSSEEEDCWPFLQVPSNPRDEYSHSDDSETSNDTSSDVEFSFLTGVLNFLCV
jgi:hypothetical protein